MMTLDDYKSSLLGNLLMLTVKDNANLEVDKLQISKNIIFCIEKIIDLKIK